MVADPAERLSRLQAGYPLGERALVEEPRGRAGPAGRPGPGPGRARATRPGSRCRSRTDADGLLVLGDPWYPQWRVEVDGRPAELLRVDHAFRGVRVPAGSHRVVFTYQDRALQAGLVLSRADRPRPGRAVVVAPARDAAFRNVPSAP